MNHILYYDEFGKFSNPKKQKNYDLRFFNFLLKNFLIFELFVVTIV